MRYLTKKYNEAIKHNFFVEELNSTVPPPTKENIVYNTV